MEGGGEFGLLIQLDCILWRDSRQISRCKQSQGQQNGRIVTSTVPSFERQREYQILVLSHGCMLKYLGEFLKPQSIEDLLNPKLLGKGPINCVSKNPLGIGKKPAKVWGYVLQTISPLGRVKEKVIT